MNVIKSLQKLLTLAALVAAASLIVSPAQAQTLVGFEGGTPFASPTGTTPAVTIGRLGDTGAVTSSFGLNPTEGSQYAVASTFSNGNGAYAPGSPLFGGAGSVAANTLWGFMFPGSANNSLQTFNIVSGSAFTFSLSMAAGSSLSFNWNYLTSEPRIAGNTDFAFVGIRLGTTGDPLYFTSLAGPSIALVDAPGGVASFDYMSGVATFTYTAASAGTYTFGIGVGDGGLEATQSGLMLDNLAYAVPEPGTVSLLVLGSLVGAVLLLRRRHLA